MTDERHPARLSISYITNALDSADLEPLLEEIRPEFADADIHGRVRLPDEGAGGTMLPEAALALAFAIAAHGFLAELGRDLYRGFRAALFAAYKKAQAWCVRYTYSPRTIVRIEIRYGTSPGSTSPTTGPIVAFDFPRDMDADAFERAVRALSQTYQGVELNSDTHLVIMEFDRESQSWRETARGEGNRWITS